MANYPIRTKTENTPKITASNRLTICLLLTYHNHSSLSKVGPNLPSLEGLTVLTRLAFPVFLLNIISSHSQLYSIKLSYLVQQRSY